MIPTGKTSIQISKQAILSMGNSNEDNESKWAHYFCISVKFSLHLGRGRRVLGDCGSDRPRSKVRENDRVIAAVAFVLIYRSIAFRFLLLSLCLDQPS